MSDPRDDRADARFMYGLGGAVTLVWAVSSIAEILSHGGYHTPLAIHGMMGTIVGAVFAEARIRARRSQLRAKDQEEPTC